jgi:hypothetical protein
MNKDKLVIYWAPGQFTSEDPHSWNQFYSAPLPVSSRVLSMKSPDAGGRSIFACPAYAESLTNVFEVSANHDEKVTIPSIFFEQPPTQYPFTLPVDSVLSLELPRESSFKDYLDVAYNMSWLFFSEEPVKVRFTAPYFPNKSPSKDALLALGEFDIGVWFRNFNLDYLIPKGSYDFSIQSGDPLFYLQVFTEKDVVFKRFIHTPSTQKLAEEYAQLGNLRKKKLGVNFSKRYEISKSAQLPKLVLNEIKKNVVE